ncbi:MAG: radical SAM family heme chaperone HemW [Desulfuromonadaceae bacterium]
MQQAAASGRWSGPLASIFFGGGTPSLLSPAQIAAILATADQNFALAADCEISLEANPGTLTLSSLLGYRRAGVNRLSLGIQTLNPPALALLGRIHSPDQSLQALTLARRAGFSNLACDLIFALPGQDLNALKADVDSLLQYEPEHFSCYGLTIEENTPLHERVKRGELSPVGEESYAQQFLFLHQYLADAGYGHYEISNYARPGFACRHNSRYWQRQACLGIGAGAHSFADQQWGIRYAVPADLSAYGSALKANLDPLTTVETFDRRGAMAETMYLGLRTRQGVYAGAFKERFGEPLDGAFAEALNQCGGYLQREGDRRYLKPEGWLIFDHLILPFL